MMASKRARAAAVTVIFASFFTPTIWVTQPQTGTLLHGQNTSARRLRPLSEDHRGGRDRDHPRLPDPDPARPAGAVWRCSRPGRLSMGRRAGVLLAMLLVLPLVLPGTAWGHVMNMTTARLTTEGTRVTAAIGVKGADIDRALGTAVAGNSDR